VGSSLDAQFVRCSFSALVASCEVFKDRALALPPLNTTLPTNDGADQNLYGLERGSWRKPIDLAALEHLMVRFSFLVVEQPWVSEIDINPLLVSPDRLTALDARVVLHGPEVQAKDLPKLAIRPYRCNTCLAGLWKMDLRDHSAIRPETKA